MKKKSDYNDTWEITVTADSFMTRLNSGLFKVSTFWVGELIRTGLENIHRFFKLSPKSDIHDDCNNQGCQIWHQIGFIGTKSDKLGLFQIKT